MTGIDEPEWAGTRRPAWGRPVEGEFPEIPAAACAAYGATHDAPVAKPGDPGDAGRFCEPCISRCHEAAEFDHVCAICREPEREQP